MSSCGHPPIDYPSCCPSASTPHRKLPSLKRSSLHFTQSFSSIREVDESVLETDAEVDTEPETEMSLCTVRFPSPSLFSTRPLLFLDWDDTLLPSTALVAARCHVDSDMRSFRHLSQTLVQLENTVITLLKTVLPLGNVHIVTNASIGWIELSCAKFFPRVVPLLSQMNVTSARSLNERFWPKSPVSWKHAVFAVGIANSSSRQAISLGDSNVEREAIRSAAKSKENMRCKSIKFVEKPSIDQLKRELDLIINCLPNILSHEGDLDLQLTVTS